ncbi:protein root UVB sensitive 6-like [Camellia sinensis]|uniref:protein root UVB sensitive 6-like n=1 Tax=Camellia sinensis TaxID=4442 RepID=UPI001035C72E|nr:protein root UVB sensitive 6-like [Camellia sinensis]
MELGAGVELATTAVPHLFLPLACATNVAKNIGAVTSTSTRTPIYKAFAKGENIGDVTAKGECVGNVADLVCFSNFHYNFQKLVFAPGQLRTYFDGCYSDCCHIVKLIFIFCTLFPVLILFGEQRGITEGDGFHYSV